jgi:hypothetical protein
VQLCQIGFWHEQCNHGVPNIHLVGLFLVNEDVTRTKLCKNLNVWCLLYYRRMERYTSGEKPSFSFSFRDLSTYVIRRSLFSCNMIANPLKSSSTTFRNNSNEESSDAPKYWFRLCSWRVCKLTSMLARIVLFSKIS